MNHELKIWPQFYERVKDGTKTFEVRDADRGFQFGDTVTLREWDPSPIEPTGIEPKGYTGSEHLRFRIGYVHIQSAGTVIFSLLPLKEKK